MPTIVDVLRQRAESAPSQVVFRFLSGESGGEELSVAELDRRARALASQLRDRGLHGQRVLLLHPAGLEFVQAFYACLYAGVIAVPAYPLRANSTLARLESMASDCGARTALTLEGLVERSLQAAHSSSCLRSLDWIASDALSGGDGGIDELPGSDQLAYLQYTSGSTSDPKGVLISHRNVVANSEVIRRSCAHDDHSRSLSWLPHFHDMGLLDGVLQPVYSGFPAILMDPMDFLQTPLRWLEAIGTHRITHSGGPNFAYDLCSRRVDPDSETLDLSSWEVAYNGAEPVRAETLERFAQRFASCGFRPEALHPAYGLAEATLQVSGSSRGARPRVLAVRRSALEEGQVEALASPEALRLVSCGRPGPGVGVRIVDPRSGRALEENEVGEIWVSGPSVAGGYWQRPEESELTFRVRVSDEEASYLRTGDLGFLRGGELFVTGRTKDLIIIRGRNVYPQDVERSVEGVSPVLRPGGSAAFSVDAGGEERLVLVHEVERRAPGDPAELFADLRRAVVESNEVDPAVLVLVKPFGVPRTTSGKVQRRACRRKFLEGNLPELARWEAPAEEVERPGAEAADVLSWLRARLEGKGCAVEAAAPLASLGLDSLRSIELAHEIERSFGVQLTSTDLLEASSLAELVRRIQAGGGSREEGSTEAAVDECPLAPGQLALWFLQELAPESSAYTISAALDLHGPLDPAALERALRAVVERHAALRTCLRVRDGQPTQRFDASFDEIYRAVDGNPGPSFSEQLGAEAQRPFDLSRDPLFRVRLYRRSDGHVLFLSVHHMVADLWSLSIVLRDLQESYACERSGRPWNRPPAPHPVEWVRRQTALIEGEAGADLFAFWRRELGGQIPSLDLPTNRTRPQAQSFRGAARTYRLSESCALGLRRLARERGATLYALLLASFQAFLARVTGETRLQVGAPTAARTGVRSSELVGFVVNTIVLRADLEQDPPFEEHLARTVTRLQAALAHQEFPFATLVRRLAPQRDPGRSPFFDVMFELRATGDLVRGDLAPGGAGRATFDGGVHGTPIPLERRAAQFDLSTTAIDDGHGLAFEFEYSTDLFDGERIDELAAAFECLLEDVVAHPLRRLSRLALARPSLRRRLLPQPEQGEGKAPAPFLERFLGQAQRTPDRIALHHGELRWSYDELRRRSNQLAHRLLERGVRREARVAVCLEKSPELFASLLAIHRVGAVFVPVDPALPSERRAFLVRDSGAELVLATDARRPEFEVPLLDPGRFDPSKEERELVLPAHPAQLAYVIYTSGTTGTPKGVAVSQGNLAGLTTALGQIHDLSSVSVHLQMAGVGFDVFLEDCVRSLAFGATLVLCERDVLLDPPALAELCRRQRVEFAEFVPSTVRALARHVVGEGRPLAGLRSVLVGSEGWPVSDLPLLRAAFGPDARIVNTYGVTEATADNAFEEVRAKTCPGNLPPIGRPLGHTSLYVLDRGLEPVLPGVVGELFLGGPAVARGYVGQPARTAERFVPDPHGAPGSRLYRTGDRARRLSDGRVEFLGRSDGQVKVRGHRIETSEVEAALTRHPRVHSALVATRGTPEVARLVGYVILEPGGEAGPWLREHCASILPDFMVPAAFVPLAAFPLTPNGKVDQRALPEPEFAGPVETLPRSEEERVLADVWGEVLGLDQVPTDRDFFELGGDSILAIQLVAKARAAGFELSPRAVFEHPTVASLARAVGRSAAGQLHGPESGEVGLLPMQAWLLGLGLDDAAHWNMAVVLDSKAPLEKERVRQVGQALLDHHDALRARFRRTGEGWRQELDPVGGPRIELTWTSSKERDHERCVTELAGELNRGLDLEQGPLFRLGVVEGACTSLIVVAHHLVVDGLSLRILIEDFERAWRQLEAGTEPSLPARTVPVSAWVRCLEERGECAVDPAHEELAERLASLAGDGQRAFEGDTVLASTRLDREQTERLLQVAASQRRSVEALLLAALACGLGRRKDLVLELEGHGRDRAPDLDVSRTVGWFTVTRPLWLAELDVERPERVLEAVDRGLKAPSAPLDRLRTLAPVLDPEVSFNYLGRFDSTLGPDSLFGNLREPRSRQRSPRALRTHRLELDASIAGGSLLVRWSWDGRAADAAERDAVRRRFEAALRDLTQDSGDVEATLPATPLQEGMLFHHLESSERDPYVAQIAFELAGEVRLETLAEAWQHTFDTQAALRASFAWEPDGRAVQVIRRRVKLPVQLHASLPDDRPRASFLEGLRRTGFDVGQAPLARVDLVRLAQGSALVVFTHHHLLFDGWSLPFVLEGVLSDYERRMRGDEPAARSIGPAYAYADWLSDRNVPSTQGFFESYLEGIPGPTSAPGTSAGGTGVGSGVLHCHAPRGLEGRAHALGLTAGSVVQAAWALLLAQSSGSEDVVFGSTSSGRPAELEGIETQVGLFINTLPLRVRIQREAGAQEWMRGLQRLGAELRQHEHASLAAVQRGAGLEAGTPLFETLLVFENYPIDVAALRRREGFEVGEVVLHEETNYPLTLVASAGEGELGFRAIYDRSRYREADVKRLLGRLNKILEELVDRPRTPLGELDLVPDEEFDLVTRTWNETALEYPRESSVPAVFGAAAQLHGSRVALVAGERSWTYAELEEETRRIACSLGQRGVGLETRVALNLDRSPEFVLAALGVLRAGAAYVPLDPSSPASRRARMLADARCALLVSLEGGGAEETGIDCVGLDELVSGPLPARPLPAVPPDALAYVIFTSGSTGEPKGIEALHRGILNLVLAGRYVEFGADRTILQLSTIAFDASTFEIWGALLHGGRLVIAPPGPRSAAEIAELFARHRVTTAFLTTGLFHVVAEESPAALENLSELILGGDVVSPEVVQRASGRGNVRLVHAYGPTETTTFATCDGLEGSEKEDERVPIGGPIANTRTLLLDPSLRPVPVGAPGEIYIGGDGLARGYASRPGLTAERFVPDPFGPPGSRLYRTGDLARWRSDGRIEFLGRRDGQVKVRGFRVEVGEVEAALASLPGVRGAAVVVSGERGAAQLAGYVAADGERDPVALRAALARRLPDYMLPERLAFLDELPLTANGKVDRRALPRFAPEREADPGPLLPRTSTEDALADIWKAVLDVPRIGPADDFFQLGGHSLHATRVAARIRRTLGVELPLRALFDAPSLRALARRVDGARREALPAVEPVSADERRPASYAQARLWFLDRLEPNSPAYNIASAVHLEGPLDVEALEVALTKVVLRHESLRTVFEEGPSGPLQRVLEAGAVDVSVEELGGWSDGEVEQEVARRVRAWARVPFDLGRGALLRARLLRCSSDRHVLSLTLHHIAADGWSIGLLVHELARLYRAQVEGVAADLAPLPVQYADWAAWQRRWLGAGEMERQLAYWRQELDGLEPLDLPADRPRPARPQYRGASLDVCIRGALARELERLSREEGTTLFMTLVSAFAVVLGKGSGQEDFGIGTPVANRTREEAEPLIGLFVNTLVLRARLGGRALTFRDLLGRMREACLGAYAHQDVPFERVVEELEPDRDLSRTPLFQAMFILQNAPMNRLELGELSLRPFEAPTGTSTFDLSVSLEPSASRVLAAGEEGAAIVGAIEYSTELFDEATIARLWEHFLRLLEVVVHDPAVNLRQVALHRGEERERAVLQWSGLGQLRTARRPWLEHFARAARAHPQRTAAVGDGVRSSYGELDERSTRLAAELRRRGVGPEVAVGLCLPRSPELCVAMLAVWKAGGAFVPCDVDHPRERIRGVLADAGVRVVLVGEDHQDLAEGRVALRPDMELPMVEAGEDALPRPDSLAYVLYTSGTTGRPKGVLVPHAAVDAVFEAWEKAYELGPSRNHLQMASAAFDVCTGDVLRALGSGGTLVFASRELLLDPGRLFELAEREQVHFAEFVPAVLRGLGAWAQRAERRLESLGTVAVGSDTWSLAELPLFRAAAGVGARFFNSYGVTEATIDSTVGESHEEGGARPSIGRPLSHATAMVLDANLEPCPPGVTGELFLGGSGVARGYAGDPARTAGRFVPDPFGVPGSRLYRTGDRARWLSDGRIDFHGRADHQIKLRGQRVEPAEIEAALLAREDVRACAVVLRREGGIDRLAAYVEVADGTEFDPEAARRALRRRLPEAWLPAAFEVLAALPLTPQGKLDRKRLPAPAWSAAPAYEEPVTEAERAVAAAFAGVLALDRVGRLDDFFSLGGHSLLAVQVVSRLREMLGVEIAVREVFENPGVRDLARGLEELDRRPAPPPVRPAEPDERVRPSYAQARLWFLDRLEPESAAYNLPTAITFDGALEPQALERALTALVRRHEALRTVFREGEDGPEQVVLPARPFELTQVDLSGLSEARRAADSERLLRAEACQPFDLAQGPLLRATLYRHGSRRHVLLVTVHHICADGWSLVVLVRELARAYRALVSGHEPDWEELEVQYADWAAWQRRWLEAGEMERQLDHWRGALEGLEPLELPFDHPRPHRPRYTGDALEIELDAGLRAKLDALALAEGATLHMVLLAGYAAMLARWSGRKDLCIGTPVANRRTTEAEGLIGFFVNTLALRIDLDGAGLTFRRLLGRVREAALAAQAHQDVPFERVVEELDPERHLGHHPLFQVLFALQNVPVEGISLPGLELSYDEPGTGVARFDLELFLAETERVAAVHGEPVAPGGLEGLLHFSSELFERDTVRRFFEGWKALLGGAVLDPDRALSELPVLGPAERTLLLREWNAPREGGGDGPPVHELVERVACESPQLSAVRMGEVSWTYGDLEARARRLAHHLRARGLRRGGQVGVCVERSLDFLTTLVAVLKSGAAYLPIDPDLPRDRIRLFLDDAGVEVLVVHRATAFASAFVAEAQLVCLDREADAIADRPDRPVSIQVPPDATAFCVYTSGSTGKPKGIEMTHRALANLLAWQRRESPGAPRTLQFAALSFDVSFQEIFATLTSGGELVVVSEEDRRDPLALLRILEETRTERVFLPFVALDLLARTASEQDLWPSALREVLVAGERLRITPAIREFFERLPSARLVNQYGPAETHVVSACPLPADPASWPELPPIGRPLPNVPIYLLDAAGRPVPVGAAGELCVGGVAPARGYRCAPHLTAGSFVPDPWSGAEGARLYRTGDFARFRVDGQLEFLGRRDLQVKIRGYRVEPGEVEAALATHPAVEQVAVRDHVHGSGRRLAAYAVLEPGSTVQPEELREHLRALLPDYMVPAAVVLLEALPLSPNGKVDREALAEPQWGDPSGGAVARTPEEEMLCGIFAEVLGLESVAADADFFLLGGHSLLATQVVSRVRKSFGLELPLRSLFETPTPLGLARALGELAGRGSIPAVRPASAEERRPLSFAQKRLWFLDRMESDSAAYNIPAAVRLRGTLDVQALAAALDRLLQRHEALRTRFPEGPHGPEQVVVELEGATLERRQVADEEEARFHLAEEARRPFDLARGPVLRALLLELGPVEHLLSVVVHHIAADGWSLAILWRELGELYAAATEGRSPDLPALTVQYADWAAWQRRWLEDGELERQLAAWRDVLEGAPASLELPTDRARPPEATWNGAIHAVRWGAELVAGLEALARREGATLHMVGLTAYAWALGRATGMDEVVIGTPVANRRTAEAEALIGFFVNTLPIRVRLSGPGLTFRELLGRVRGESLEAYANQDVPFERVVEELQPERSLNRAPIFQTAFAVQELELGTMSCGELTMTPFDVENETAKFDLMLLLGPDEGGLSGAIEYNTDLFEAATIERLATRLGRGLARACAEPDRPLSLLPGAEPGEAQQLLREWSVSGVELGTEGLAHRLFEAQVDQDPDALALYDANVRWTYRELEARANRLASYLIALGVRPEERVVLVLERSPQVVLAILGVLKCGAAYVPLDPEDPPERLATVLEDCGARRVLTLEALESRVPAGPWTALCLDRETDALQASSSKRPDLALQPAQLAYVVYTSGSTGRPKGVAVEHRSIASYTASVGRRLGVEPGWRFAWISSVAADLGNTALFSALASGGSLFPIPPALALDAPALQAELGRHPVDCLKIVPSHLAALLHGPNPAQVLPRKRCVLGGEATPGSLLARITELAPDTTVVNHYGPTEVTVGAVAGAAAPGDEQRPSLPLGRPLADLRAYVLDALGRPQPVDVPGELFLAGMGVARGYVGRADLTAQSFLPDPFAEKPGARMYRTGDRARWLADGRLEFLGRKDSQVKVRGFRVELGEIEAALRQHPDVEQCAVVVREEAGGGGSLASYVVARRLATPEIRGLARRPLPSGLAMAELNRNETDYLHREVVELGAYVRHGIQIADGDTVFDVGGNIGMFSVFASGVSREPRLFVFEPNPKLHAILRANAEVYAPRAQLFDFGLAETERTAEFTFFPGFSLLSGLYADAEEERGVVRSFVANQARSGVEGAGAFAEVADDVLAERFRPQALEVRLRTLSAMLDETGVERIDLLKINVEKAELDVVRGIRAEHWKRIDQAVVEVDVEENLPAILSLFEQRGFDVHVDQDPWLEGTQLCYVYAVRRGSGRRLRPGAPPSVRFAPLEEALVGVEGLREHLLRCLPGSMQPSSWTFLDALPLTANGKLDRRRLPAPDAGRKYEAPRGELEEALARIWAAALGVERVGIHDNFFDLGGHSLLLTQVHARVQSELGANLAVVELFRYPTVAALAGRIGTETPEASTEGHRDRGARRRRAARRVRSRRDPEGESLP